MIKKRKNYLNQTWIINWIFLIILLKDYKIVPKANIFASLLNKFMSLLNILNNILNIHFFTG